MYNLVKRYRYGTNFIFKFHWKNNLRKLRLPRKEQYYISLTYVPEEDYFIQ